MRLYKRVVISYQVNMLPELPRVLNKKEAEFGVSFRKYWELHPIPGEIELKDTRGKDYLAFSEFSEEQEHIARRAISAKGALIRRAVGTPGGADYSGLVNSLYWIVIKYPSGFVIISIDTFLLERSRSKRKSLLWSRAQEISTVTVQLAQKRDSIKK